MLRLTTRATEHLVKVRRERGLDASRIPRFVRRDGRLALTFVPGPEAGDRVVDGGRISTLVAASASDLMDAATIEVKTTGDRTALVVYRRRAEAGGPARRGRSTAGATS
jgi:hypothetical protein